MFKLIIPSKSILRASVFHKLVGGFAIIFTISFLLEWIIEPQNFLPWAIFICLFYSSSLLSLFVNKKGYKRIASIIFVYTSIALIFGLAWLAGGINAPVIQLIPVTILIAGLMLGWKHGLLTVIIAALVGLGLVFAEIFDFLPTPIFIHSSLSLWFFSILSVGWLTLLVLYIAESWNKVLFEVRQEQIPRKIIEENIREKESHTSTILDLTNEFIAQLTSDGILLDVNQTALEFAGIKPEDVLGKPFWEMPWWNHSTEMQNILRTAIRDAATGEIVQFEATHKGAEGAIHTIDFSLKPYKDNASAITLLLAEGRDITKRKRAEEALLYESQVNKAIIEASPAFIGAIKPDGKTLMMNHAMLNALGYTLDEVVDKDYLNTFVPPKDHNNLTQVFRQVSKELKSTISENQILTKDGRTIDAVWHGAPILNGDKVDYFIGIGIEISSRKRAEDKLKVSEEKFRTLFENMPNGFSLSELVFDDAKNIIDLKILEANKIAVNCLNLSNDEIINRTVTEIKSNFNPEKHKETIHVALTGKPSSFEWHNVEKDTYYHTYLYSPQRHMVATILEDITNQKKAELAQRESENKYSMIVNTANEGILMVDKNINLTFVNAQLAEILGYKPQEMIGQSVEIFFYKVDLNDHRKKIENRIKGIAEKFERRFCRKDGTVIWFLASVKPIIDNNNGFQGSIAMLTNITDLKIIEEKLKHNELLLQRIIDSSPNIIYIKELPAYKNIFVNKSIWLILGYTVEQFQAMNFDDICACIHPEDIQQYIDYNTRLCSINENEILELQYRVKHAKNGQWRWFRCRDVLFNRNCKDNSVQILGIVVDITEQKNTERKILNATIEAEERERAYFARELHDGLGPLLSSIKLFFQWLNKPDKHAAREDIMLKGDATIKEAIASLKEISNRLSPYLLTNFGLTVAIKSFIDKLKGTSSIQIFFQSNIEQRFERDIEITLYRITIECINNTLKYANAEKISIIIMMKTPGQITLDYTDNGIGFDYSEIIRTGKGLGLFNMQNRIATIGGSFCIKTQPSKGVKIRVSLYNVL